MNTFIKEKTSARKSILSKFLNIQIYEELYKQSREEYIVLKNSLNNKSEKDWTGLSQLSLSKTKENASNILKLQDEIAKFRGKIIDLNVKLSNLTSKKIKHSSGHTKISAAKELDYLMTKASRLQQQKQEVQEKLNSIKDSLHKIDNFKKSFSIDELNNEKNRLALLEKKLSVFKNSLSESNDSKKRIENELKILDQVPCGDDYPTCMFIKKAHEDKSKIGNVKKEAHELEINILELNSIISRIKEKELNQKIRKFENVLQKEYKLSVDKESFILKLGIKEKEINTTSENLQKIKNIVIDLKESASDEAVIEENNLNTQISDLQNKINNGNLKILSYNKDTFVQEEAIKRYEVEKNDYYNLIEEFKIYDVFSSCVSKKGIPTMLINSYLPFLNKEINAILSGVVSFKISLEEDVKGNNLNVYIDYGDSKRVIECASGMEKMISSIAIRVALINISSLAKSDIFIIDEGFGALDDSNIEACSRLLNSLKKYFKSIIIISHIDAIKDIVDKNIEINVKGVDAHVRFE